MYSGCILCVNAQLHGETFTTMGDMFMKKFLAVILVLAMSMALFAGCANNEGGSSAGGKGKDKIVVGLDDSFPPMGFRDEKGEIVGFDIDVAKAAAEKMGVDIEFQPIDWNSNVLELNNGTVDLLWNGLTITEKRQKEIDFTKPYLKNHQIIIVKADNGIEKKSDLEGKVVGIQKGSSAVSALEKDEIHDKIKTLTEFKENVSALNDLKTGRLDAVVVDEVVGKYYVAKDAASFKILDETLAEEEYGIGVKKGNTELLNKLQAALDEIYKDGTVSKISEKWFGDDIVMK